MRRDGSRQIQALPATGSRIFQDSFGLLLHSFPEILLDKMLLVAEYAEVERFLGDLLMPHIGFLDLSDKGQREGVISYLTSSIFFFGPVISLRE